MPVLGNFLASPANVEAAFGADDVFEQQRPIAIVVLHQPGQLEIGVDRAGHRGDAPRIAQTGQRRTEAQVDGIGHRH